MQQLPDIKHGDTVRIMQTDDMVRRGLANRKFKVTRIIDSNGIKGYSLIGGREIGTNEFLEATEHSVEKIEDKKD